MDLHKLMTYLCLFRELLQGLATFDFFCVWAHMGSMRSRFSVRLSVTNPIEAPAVFKPLLLLILVTSLALTSSADSQAAPTNPTDWGSGKNTMGAGSADRLNPSTPQPGATQAPPVTAPATIPSGGQPQGTMTSRLPVQERDVKAALSKGLSADVLPPRLQPTQGGLTKEDVSRLARKHSFALKASRALQMAAEAESREAARRLWPQLQLSARYTRLSPWTNQAFPNFDTLGCINNLSQCQTNPSQYQTFFPIPTFVNQYNLRATLTVPLSDIILRLRQFYDASKLTESARALDAVVAEQNAALSGQEAFFEFLRAVGQDAIATQAIEAAASRRKDVENFVTVGTAAKVDLFKLDALLADLKRIKTFAENALELATVQLRQRIGFAKDRPIASAEPLDTWPEVPRQPDRLVETAWTKRPELHMIDRQIRAIESTVGGTKASLYPSLAGAANADMANPNTRFFPQTDTFRGTWDATLQLTWSPNDAWIADATIDRLRAQQAQLRAQRAQTAEAFEIEVRGLWNQAVQAKAQVSSSLANLEAAEETARVKRAARKVGTATETEMLDAHVELLRARMGVVNAQIDVRIALARLNRAVSEIDAL